MLRLSRSSLIFINELLLGMLAFLSIANVFLTIFCSIRNKLHSRISRSTNFSNDNLYSFMRTFLSIFSAAVNSCRYNFGVNNKSLMAWVYVWRLRDFKLIISQHFHLLNWWHRLCQNSTPRNVWDYGFLETEAVLKKRHVKKLSRWQKIEIYTPMKNFVLIDE